MSKLAAQIEATNIGHKRANELYKELVEIFRPLVGQKIQKADGNLLAKVEKLMPKIGYTHKLHVYKNVSRWSLSYVVKSCVAYSESCVYDETTVYIGTVDGDTLIRISDYEEKRCDYTLEEIQQKRKEYNIVKAQLEKIGSELFPFSVD